MKECTVSNPALERLLRHPAIFRAGHGETGTPGSVVPTGYSKLDETLPHGGWPLGKLTELIHGQEAIDGLALVVPALASITHDGYTAVFVNPPHIPYAPGLSQMGISLDHLIMTRDHDERDRLWAAEQSLKSGAAVLLWEGHALSDGSLRRLQRAAETGKSLAFLFRCGSTADVQSPAALRLHLTSSRGKLSITIAKSQGSRHVPTLQIPLSRSRA